MNLKQWTKICKGLANENRLKILSVLSRGGEQPVNLISSMIGLGAKRTSHHLIILHAVGFLESQGKQRSVWYRLHPELLSEIKKVVKLVAG